MGIAFLSLIILKNGIQIFQYKGKEIVVFFESPYFFKIDERETFDVGITYSRYKKMDELYSDLNSFNVKYRKNVIKYESDIINLVSGYYLTETLSYSSLIVFVPDENIEELLYSLNNFNHILFSNNYDINIEPIQGFFSISQNTELYMNLPPDIMSKNYIPFRIFMKYLENKGRKVIYSKFGKIVPFFVNIEDKYDAIRIFKDPIDYEDLKKAKTDFYREYKDIKDNEVLLNLFLSISGIKIWNFIEEWERKILGTTLEEIESFRKIYSTGGIFCDKEYCKNTFNLLLLDF